MFLEFLVVVLRFGLALILYSIPYLQDDINQDGLSKKMRKVAPILAASIALPWLSSGFLQHAPKSALPKKCPTLIAWARKVVVDDRRGVKPVNSNQRRVSTASSSANGVAAWGKQAHTAALAGLMALFLTGSPIGLPMPSGWQPSLKAWAEESTPLVGAAPATAAPVVGRAEDFNKGPAGGAGTSTMAAVDYPTDPVVEEAWQLLNKFYVDKSFKGQDWNAVRKEANAKGLRENSYSAIDLMAKSLGDKYTRAVDKTTYAALAKFDLIGAGVLFSPDDDGQMVVASPPMESSAAQKAKLQKGDKVMQINGQPTKGMSSFDVVDLVSQSESATLELVVQSVNGNGQERAVSLPRKVAFLADPVVFKMLPNSKTGYLRLAEFNARAPLSMKHAIQELEKEGAERYILDLRGNGGGTFQTATQIASLFMADRPVTFAADNAGTKTEFRSERGSVLTDDPLMVWQDQGSASAAEVLTGGLHDNCRALVAGDRSFGKGLIQGVFGLNDGSGLIVTVAKYQTPAGSDINGYGVQPDLKKPLGGSWLGGLVRSAAEDMPESEWQLAAARQGGKLCEAVAPP